MHCFHRFASLTIHLNFKQFSWLSRSSCIFNLFEKGLKIGFEITQPFIVESSYDLQHQRMMIRYHMSLLLSNNAIDSDVVIELPIEELIGSQSA